MREYDIIAIGGGSGGIATVNRAGEHGAKAAVIEKFDVGRYGLFDRTHAENLGNNINMVLNGGR